MGLTEKQKQLIEAVSKNDIMKARRCAVACCEEDKTAKNSAFCRRYESILKLPANNMIELPYELKNILYMEDVSNSFLENRYYLSDRERKVYEQIEKMQQVTRRLMELKIPYLNTTLLYGESGTGKTTFGRYVAYKLELPFCYVNFSQLMDSYMGKTSKNISKVFEYISGFPCVLMLDEIDCISIRRAGVSNDGGANGEMARVTISLLQEFDRLSNTAVVLGATNRMDRIDEALLRRFSIQHEVKALTLEERILFIKCFLDDVSIELENTEELAKEYPNQSALLNAIIREISEQMLQKET